MQGIIKEFENIEKEFCGDKGCFHLVCLIGDSKKLGMIFVLEELNKLFNESRKYECCSQCEFNKLMKEVENIVIKKDYLR